MTNDNEEQVGAMMNDDHLLLGLSDAGAHCGVLCDASVPTYMLCYMTRDRTKGEKLPLEQKDVKLKGWALEARINLRTAGDVHMRIRSR